jgi:hypothetical protein
VRDGKGEKDRITLLPEAIHKQLPENLSRKGCAPIIGGTT